MFGFGNNDEKARIAETSDDDPPVVTLVRDETVTFEYTEHRAKVGFVTGGSRMFTFDELEKTDDSYVLYEYTGDLRAGCGTRNEVRPDGSIKVATIQKENMTFIHTMTRTDKELTTEVHEEANGVPLPRAMYEVEQDPNTYWFDEDTVSDEALRDGVERNP
jgi:hypothetical protein